MEENPYAAPKSEVVSGDSDISISPTELENTAQFLNLTVLFYAVLQFLNFAGGFILTLFVAFAYLASLYYLLKNGRFQRPWLYMVGSLIPLINLVLLFMIIRRASSLLRAHGYKIGLMGAKKE